MVSRFEALFIWRFVAVDATAGECWKSVESLPPPPALPPLVATSEVLGVDDGACKAEIARAIMSVLKTVDERL